jgi:AcrR family transcriptional regulator
VPASSRRSAPSRPPVGRERPNARGSATRLSILLKAEELFAQRGIEAVPLRDIAAAAGQKNNVAVQYHFGDRQNLVREIATYRAASSEQMRSELLAEMLGSGEPPTVFALVQAFMSALTCHLEPGNHYLAFLSRYSGERGDYGGLQGTAGGTLNTFLALLRRLLPDFPEAVVQERWMVMMTSAVNTLARYQTAQHAGHLPAPLDDLLDDLVRFFTAGIEAPIA